MVTLRCLGSRSFPEVDVFCGINTQVYARKKDNCAGVFVHVLRGRTMVYFFFFFGILCCIVTSRVFLCGTDYTYRSAFDKGNKQYQTFALAFMKYSLDVWFTYSIDVKGIGVKGFGVRVCVVCLWVCSVYIICESVCVCVGGCVCESVKPWHGVVVGHRRYHHHHRYWLPCSLPVSSARRARASRGTAARLRRQPAVSVAVVVRAGLRRGLCGQPLHHRGPRLLHQALGHAHHRVPGKTCRLDWRVGWRVWSKWAWCLTSTPMFTAVQ